MNLRVVKVFVKKEFKQIIRDNSSVLIAFILPLILLFLFGFGVNFDTNTVKIGIVDLSNSIESRDFIQSLNDTRYLETRFFKTTNKAEISLAGGKIRGYVVIPVNYAIELKKKTNPKIQIITDGTEPNTAKFVSSYIQGAYQAYIQYENSRQGGLNKTKTITANIRSWYNPALKSTYFILPGSLAIIMTMTGTVLTALVIAREWERGTMEAILTTNITKGEFILAKYIAYFVLGFLSILFCLFLIIFVFKVPFYGSYIALFVVSSLFMLTGLGLGLLISTIFKDQFTSSQIAGSIGFMPSMMLSGLIYEIDSMPFLIKTISNIIPAKYYVSAVTSLFLSGTIFKIILFSSIYMLVFSIMTAILIYKNTTERLENC